MCNSKICALLPKNGSSTYAKRTHVQEKHFLPVSSGFHSYTHAFRSLLRVFYALSTVQDTCSKNAQVSCATTSCPWRDTNTCCNHGYNAVADDSCASSHLLTRIRHSLPIEEVEKVEKVKYCGSIHIVRSLPDQGGDVCKVWFRLIQKCDVNLYKVQTNKQTFSFIYKTCIFYPIRNSWFRTTPYSNTTGFSYRQDLRSRKQQQFVAVYLFWLINAFISDKRFDIINYRN